MVVSFQFPGHGADDLSSGCQPFIVAYAGSASHYAALAAASVANQLSQGDQSATLSDYRTIRDNERLKFPRDMSEVTISLTRYAVLCQCLFQGLGPAHPFVETMWALALNMQNGAPFITERYHHVARSPHVASLYFARILRAVQLSAYDYLQHVSTNVGDGVVGVELPVFGAMLQDLRRGTFHISTNRVNDPEVHLDPVQLGSSTMSVPRSAAPGSVATSTSGASRSQVSALTQDSTVSGVARMENPTRDTDFSSITIRAGGARAIMRENRPPNNDAGHEFCVAW